jgi:hypothetical protein
MLENIVISKLYKIYMVSRFLKPIIFGGLGDENEISGY